MVNLKQFLLKNIKDGEIGCYALITYNNRTEATWFTKYYSDIDNQPWFLESPCELYKICKVDKPIEDFCKTYMDECIELEEGESVQDYIEEHVKPMIVNSYFYEIENFQVAPYLPKEVDDIKIITERECLEWMLDVK